ncbi:hypothetical protein CYLTODRAFT_405518 [Cylindrobasidium torrendii FP15055 ss-10]|uniref:ARM repeat-containing protein n=1 Tax=Cylindrobasidium torrendii FP15055 ss-10 TaxID=1314674 RepID=A0A0D7AW55_9AGAR|nr:hypothetical protein CYLTODRAFT_405518 [Cylindrobasidium torrendii FP15055 ss-10]
MLPPLVESTDPAAARLLVYIGDQGNARETILATQEETRKLRIKLSDGKFDEYDETMRRPNAIVLSILRLYASALPRVQHRKKSPQEILRTIVPDLVSALNEASEYGNTTEARSIISTVVELVQRSLDWVKSKPDISEEDSTACGELLKSLLREAVGAYAQLIKSHLSGRTFVRCFPKYRMTTKLEAGEEDWEVGAEAMRSALSLLVRLGVQVDRLVTQPSFVHLVLVAHSDDISSKTLFHLQAFQPVILSAIQTNTILDETLSFLIEVIHTHSASPMSPEVAIPLCHVLPALASVHQSANVRHQTFRILSLILGMVDPALRMQILKDLCTDEQFPQMRVAAVGLVKEAILSALNATEESIFASPRLLQGLGTVIFRTDPIDFCEQKPTLEELQDSTEPQRLAECLSLLYILLMRDKGKNRTGIWDKDNLKNIDKVLLAPLKTMLESLFENEEVQQSHSHSIMPLVALQTGLERVQNVLQ